MRFLPITLAMMACNEPKSEQSVADESSSVATKLYNDCILTQPIGEIPSDVYTVTSPVATTEYGQFSKVMKVYGITLVAKSDVSDEFLTAVGQAIVDIFPGDVSDATQQEEILRNLYQYKALIPVFAGGEAGFDPQAIDTIPGDHSICDIIMSDVDGGGQVMEVMEHILHIVSNVGLHYTYPDQWGLTNSSDVYAAMQQSQQAGVYNTTDYQDIDEEDVLQRILLQEFAYWIITSHWNIQTMYGPNDGFEWSATTPEDLTNDLPLSQVLLETTIAATMSPPAAATLAKLEEYGE